jgi:hypothetical protein
MKARLPYVPKEPVGYCLTVNQEVVTQAGKNGVIKDRDVAMSLRESLILANPESDVFLFGLFSVTS